MSSESLMQSLHQCCGNVTPMSSLKASMVRYRFALSSLVVTTVISLGWAAAFYQQVPKLGAHPTPEVTPVVADEDVIFLQRQGQPRAITIDQLRAFLGVVDPPNSADDPDFDQDCNPLVPMLG